VESIGLLHRREGAGYGFSGRPHCDGALLRYDMVGRAGHVVPIYLLDTDMEENTGWDRGLTDHLYGGDTNYRLEQEIVLGMGGARMASALGHKVNVHHMNEGHAALLTLALLERQLGGGPLNGATEADIEEVRNQCVLLRTRRFRPATTASPPSRPFAFWAATGRRAWS